MRTGCPVGITHCLSHQLHNYVQTYWGISVGPWNEASFTFVIWIHLMSSIVWIFFKLIKAVHHVRLSYQLSWLSIWLELLLWGCHALFVLSVLLWLCNCGQCSAVSGCGIWIMSAYSSFPFNQPVHSTKEAQALKQNICVCLKFAKEHFVIHLSWWNWCSTVLKKTCWNAM